MSSIFGSGAGIGSTVIGGTTGSVLFVGTSGTLGQDNANFFWDDTNNFLGLITAVPTHTITLGSTSTGYAAYNTADQTTNYERVTQGWVTNVFTIQSIGAGTQAARNLTVQCTSGGLTDSLTISRASWATAFAFSANLAGSGAGNWFTMSSLGSASTAVVQTVMAILPTWTQTVTAGYTCLLINSTQTTVGSGVKNLIDLQVGAASKHRIDNTGHQFLDSTITAGGTTGNQTIDKPTGTVNIAAAGTTVTVTNALVTTSSIIFAVIRTNDTTARIANVVPGAGSFVINIVAATAEVSIGFIVFN